jgi:RNA polymerase sigma-70 factor (ECF subfamily)
MSRPVLEVIDGGRATGQAWLKVLYSTYGGAVYSRCRFLLKDPVAAEDAMQDVFARAWQREGSFRSEASVLTWLLTIATHHCLNLRRGERARWREHYAVTQQLRGEAHGGAQALEDRDSVRRALAAFDLETQRAAIHYHVDEMSLAEVARTLERSVPTIRKRLEAFARESGQALRPGEEEEPR